MTTQDLIADLRLNHEYCPKEVILQAADVLEAQAKEIERLKAPQERKQEPPFAYYDQTTQTLGRTHDDFQRGATIWPLYRSSTGATE